MEEELVRAEVRLQDVKKADAGAASSGVTGGIMGAIRKTSDAFANSFHMMTGTGQQNQANSAAAAPSNDAPSADQQKERRMSDIEHLWQTSRQIHGF
ncbi:hypothetical protein ANCCEY_10701 [Ancylostoma ceylanicum]|uniref:Uncharacterized protein n=1 Tax=Ancylostoma ceylanicum TaxID=53326 RepID=A0A0D6LDN1_9BILA|nr:hypothetical protein ANCCEY_10701 [Ancylostoma ceylanicum]